MRDVFICAVLIVAVGAYYPGEKPILPVPTECPEINGNVAVHIANENDCTKFYKCNYGDPVPMDCPYSEIIDGYLHFNKELQVCDWPWSAGCEESPEKKPTTTTTSTTTEEPTTTTTSTTTEEPTTTTTEEPTTTTTTSTTTEEPTTTTTTSTTTEEPTTTTTTSTTTEEPTTTTTEEPTTTTTTSTTTEEPTTTTTTEEPTTTTTTSTTTEEPTTTTTTSTTTEESTTTTTTSTTTEEPTTPEVPEVNEKCPKGQGANNTKLPDKTNCKNYYVCHEDGKAHKETCEEDYVFDPETMMCDLDFDGTICSQKPSSSSSSTPKPNSQQKCPEVDDPENPIILPHECQCHIYFVCQNGKKVEEYCPGETRFDTKSSKCKPKAEATCVGSHEGQTTTTEEQPKTTTNSYSFLKMFRWEKK